MSGLLGAVAGGAAGVLGGWDDNRQKIKEEANKAYAMKLESLRASNNMANTAEKGRLRAEEAGTERDFKANQNRLDRAILEKRAGAGGKGGENQQYKAMAKTHQFLMEKEGKTPDEVKHMSWLGKQLGVGMPVDPNKKSLADTMRDFDAKGGDSKPSPVTKQPDAKPTLAEKYPTKNKPRGILAGVSGWMDEKAASNKQSRADSVMTTIQDIEAALNSGEAINPLWLTQIESAMYMKGLDPEAKKRIESIYAKAKGY